MEESESSCTAVCVVNKKLLIADNNIFDGTKEGKVKFQLEIVTYLAYLVTDNDDKEKSKRRKELIRRVLLQKIKSKFKGSLTASLSKKVQQAIVSKFLDYPDSQAEEIEKILQLHHSKDQLATIIEIGKKLVRRLKRVEDFLNDSPYASLASALKGYGKSNEFQFIKLSPYGAANLLDQDWLLNVDDAGCALLLTNDKGTHAELKIIDYLLAARLLTSEQSIDVPYFIGISKKCCIDCNLVIDVINECTGKVLKKENIIKVTAKHHLVFENWRKNLPIFLLQPVMDEHADTYQQGLGYCETCKSVGYLLHSDHTTTTLDSMRDIDKSKVARNQVWLYRDYKPY